MKKFLMSFIILFCCIQNVGATVTTYERTTDNYLVPDSITVTSSNKSSILKTPAVNEKEKIYDFANLLTSSEEEKLYEKVNDYIETSNYDLAIVTINYNNKNSAEAYADDFFDYNNFGFSARRDGLLILIDMDTREIYVSTSGMAIKMYNDARIDGIIDAGYYYLKNQDYYECLTRMLDKIDNYYTAGYPSGNNNLIIDDNGNPYYIKKIPYILIFLMSGVICAITSSILYFKTSSKIKKQNTVTYINPNITNIIKNDQFVTTYTSRIRIQSSSGGSGGGSSFHSSSSGRSHGGGGRSF